MGKRQGVGQYTWKRKKPERAARYVGDYFDNMRHGQGMMVYPDGSRYKGTFIEGQRSGLGLFLYSNMDTYDGEWLNNVKHGQGVYQHLKTKVHGTWVNGWLCGPVQIHYQDHIIHCNFEVISKQKQTEGDFAFDENHDTIVIDSKPKLPCTIQFKNMSLETNELNHVGIQ